VVAFENLDGKAADMGKEGEPESFISGLQAKSKYLCFMFILRKICPTYQKISYQYSKK